MLYLTSINIVCTALTLEVDGLKSFSTRTTFSEKSCALKARVNQYHRPSSSDAQISAVYTHIKIPSHSFSAEKVVIWDKEGRWFERSVWDAICERLEQPTLNKKRGTTFSPVTGVVGHRRTSPPSQPVHKPDEDQRCRTQRRNVLTVRKVFELLSLPITTTGWITDIKTLFHFIHHVTLPLALTFYNAVNAWSFFWVEIPAAFHQIC